MSSPSTRTYSSLSDSPSTKYPDWTLKTNAIAFNAESLALLTGPGVYMYLVNNKAIYVGSAKSLAGRSMSRGHHQRKNVSIANSLMLFPCDTHAEALELEMQMISDLRPRFNGRGFKKVRAKKLAKAMGISLNRAAVLCT